MAEKPPLKKANALDLGYHEDDGKKLSRGISSTVENSNIVCLARHELGSFTGEVSTADFPVHTFSLPDFTAHSDGFRQFLESELIEKSTLNALESSGRLNWWVQYGVGQRLYPLVTTGDGNCLLHAASLGMWGFHDRLLTLRKALYAFLTTHPCRHALRRRWQWQLAIQNAEAGLIYSKEEWEKEWDGVLKLASSQPRTFGRLETVTESPDDGEDFGNQTYESLEEMHVLALAHVLRRPIVIVADTVLRDVNGEPLAPIPFGGVYLPLEIPSKQCFRSPLILSFDASHFSALVAMEPVRTEASLPPAVIPVTDPDGLLLPVQFEVDPGEDLSSTGLNSTSSDALAEQLALSPADRLGLLAEYLDVTYVPIGANGSGNEPDSPDSKRNKKQANAISKQFGSIGKSMGKKLKKNIMDSFNHKKKKDDSRATTPLCQEFIMAALLHIDKRHGYQQEMINNYMISAKRRFERQKEQKQLKEMEKSKENVYHLAEQAALEGPTMCINQGCNMYGTAVTSYMCTACYARQREEEEKSKVTHKNLESSAMYGVGKSHFFAESTQKDHDSASKIPVAPSSKNPSLYLSNSTFYTDKKPGNEESYLDKKPVIEEKRSLPTYVFGELPSQKSEVKQPVEKIVPIHIEKRENPLLISEPKSFSVDKNGPLPIAVETERPLTRRDSSRGMEEKIKQMDLALKNLNAKHRESILARDRLDSTMTGATSVDRPLRTDRSAGHIRVEPGSTERIIPITLEYSSTNLVKRASMKDLQKLDSEIIDLTRKPCRSIGCKYYGCLELNGLCSQCHHQRLEGTLTRNALLEKLRMSQVK